MSNATKKTVLTEPVQVTMDKKTKAAIRKIAKANHISFSAAARLVMRAGVDPVKAALANLPTA